MNINTVTFVAPNLTCGEARGGRIPAVGCNRRAKATGQIRRNPQGGRSFWRRLRSSLLTDLWRVCSSLAPRLRQKSLAANVMTTKLSTHQKTTESNDKSIGKNVGAATQMGCCDPRTNANSGKRIGSARWWPKPSEKKSGARKNGKAK